MPRFSHAIFDLDGTLVDTRADLTSATNYVLAVLGLPQLSLGQVAGFVGHGARTLVEKALGPDHSQLADRGLALFLEYYSAHLLDQTRFYAGLDAVLRDVYAAGVWMSILTNKPETASRAIVAGLGYDSLFLAIVGGDTLPVKKPDPQGVWYLQQHSGVALHETVLIGDSRVDYETGVAAGVAMCGVTWGFGAQDFLTCSPQFLVDTPEQLRDVILG